MSAPLRHPFLAAAVLAVLLGHVSSVFAVPTAAELVESMRDDDETTAHAAQQMLIKMGPDAVRPLQKSLQDADFRLRRRAADALGELGPIAKRAAPDLVVLLTDTQPDVHDAAQKALYKMGDDAIPPLAEALRSRQEGLRKIALDTLSGCGPKATPYILKIANKDESSVMRGGAAEALGNIKPAGPEVIDSLIVAMGDMQESVRGAAADALGQQGPSAKAAIGALIVASHNDKDSLVRKRAADALPHLGPAGKESMTGLISCLHDPNVEVRQQVVEAMAGANVPFSDGSPILASALRDGDPSVRLRAMQVVVTMSTPSATAIPMLRQGLADASIDVRAAAIDALGHFRDSMPDAAQLLQPLLKDNNPVIRQDAIHALGNLGPAGLPGLIQALGDNYSSLGDEAAKAILKFGPDAIPSLQPLLQSPDPAVKARATALLNRLEHKTSAPQKTRRKTHSSSK